MHGISATFGQSDLSRLISYFTPDYTAVGERGNHLTKEKTREAYQRQFGRIEAVQSLCVIQSLMSTLTGMLVEMPMHSVGTGEKRFLFAKLRGTFTNDLWVRDLWLKTSHGWCLQHRQTIQHDFHVPPLISP